MRRKLVFASLVILLMVSVCFSEEPPRNPIVAPGKTNFANIAVTGLNKDGEFGNATGSTYQSGIPGYIEMTSTAGKAYYLYIDARGNLRIASASTVATAVSARVADGLAGWQDASGTVVGSQAEGGSL